MYYSAGAAIKYHRLGGLNKIKQKKNVFSYSLEARSPRSKSCHSWFMVRALWLIHGHLVTI